MGMDIYSGTLTRNYSRYWTNITQQLAEENGQKCVVTDGCGNEIKPVEDPAEIEQIREAVSTWAENLTASLPTDKPMPIWDETTDKDYYTDKPDWEAYGALIMLQACQSLNCPLPEYVESGWNAYDEPFWRRYVPFICFWVTRIKTTICLSLQWPTVDCYHRVM